MIYIISLFLLLELKKHTYIIKNLLLRIIYFKNIIANIY